MDDGMGEDFNHFEMIRKSHTCTQAVLALTPACYEASL